MKTTLAFLAGFLAATVTGGMLHTHTSDSVLPVAVQQRQPPGGMVLLPGYVDYPRGSSDTVTGRISRENGPVIAYDIGDNAGNHARGYAERNPSRTWSFTLTYPSGGSAVITFDERAELMFVNVGNFADFQARAVRSKRDIAEILAMVFTFDQLKFLGLK